MTDFVTIDGATGGGQMLRNAVALSAVSGRAVRVVNVRSARRNPGLQPQHLTGIKAVAEACGAELRGGSIGSREIEFVPGRLQARREWRVDVGTAGSVALLLQSLLPALAHAEGETPGGGGLKPALPVCDLTLIGGTDVPFAPPFDYVTRVFLPALRQLDQQVEIHLVRRGYYPRGGGEVRARVIPSRRVQPIQWTERGEDVRVQGRAFSMNLPEHIAERMRSAALAALSAAGYEAEIAVEIAPAGPSTGCGIALWAETEAGLRLGGGALGERGKPAERVGEEAAQSLLGELALPGAVDSHLADQLVVWLALADGESEFTTRRVSNHLVTAAQVAEAIVGARFTIEEGQPVRVRCRPAGRS